ncbi:MAG: nucleoside deaminase [Nitrospirae bacterium]|nr:nucleoside deaminase [Nitrospirota bacterium]
MLSQLSKSSHERFMDVALQEAGLAVSCGDVPVGAVAVIEGEIISKGYNMREAQHDPTAHAEMVVIRECAEKLGRWRLNDITLYVTIEPCVMCAGALILARIPRVVFGVYDAKFGGGGSVFQILQDPVLNHRVEIVSGIREDMCRKILQDFFYGRRQSLKIAG